MTKEEKIQEEWGEDFNKIINSDGWMLYDNQSDIRDLVKNSKFDFKKNEVSRNVFFRPKSLQGIENNNGWIKIESEEDLPKENCDVWCIIKNSDVHYRRFQVNMSRWWTEYIKYYQPIQKPKPPLY